MMSDFSAIFADATNLSVGDRIQLIEALWDTVPPEAEWPLSTDWREEIKRRSAEFDAGNVKTVPWEQIRADALRRAGVTVPDASH